MLDVVAGYVRAAAYALRGVRGGEDDGIALLMAGLKLLALNDELEGMGVTPVVVDGQLTLGAALEGAEAALAAAGEPHLRNQLAEVRVALSATRWSGR